MRRLGVPLVLLALVAPAEAAAYTPPAVQYTGAIAGTDAFVGIVKRGDRFRAYVSRVQRGRLLHQSGIWELRLNLGRGSAAAYRRLSQAIGALAEQVFQLERYQRSAC